MNARVLVFLVALIAVISAKHMFCGVCEKLVEVRLLVLFKISRSMRTKGDSTLSSHISQGTAVLS